MLNTSTVLQNFSSCALLSRAYHRSAAVLNFALFVNSSEQFPIRLKNSRGNLRDRSRMFEEFVLRLQQIPSQETPRSLLPERLL